MILDSLPDAPVPIGGLSPEMREEGVRLHRECFPAVWKALPEEAVLKMLYRMDLREVMAMPDSEDDKGRSLPFWAVGLNRRVFLGRWENWYVMLVAAREEDGWSPNDPKTILPVRLCAGDASELAQIWRTRSEQSAVDKGDQTFGMLRDLITLLGKGAVEIKAGAMPSNRGLMGEKISAQIQAFLGYSLSKELVDEVLNQDQEGPLWAVGADERVFIGHWDVWEMFLGGALEEDGWMPKDPATRIIVGEETSHMVFPHKIGSDDALELARIWKGRMAKTGADKAATQVARFGRALCALFMKGAVRVEPGPQPKEDDLFLVEPDMPPHLRPVTG